MNFGFSNFSEILAGEIGQENVWMEPSSLIPSPLNNLKYSVQSGSSVDLRNVPLWDVMMFGSFGSDKQIEGL